MSTEKWQRLAYIGVCASAAVFLGGWAWAVVGYLAQVLGLFFGGWLIACLQEPLVAAVMRRTRAAHSTAVLATYLIVLSTVAVVWLLLAPVVSQQVTTSASELPVQVDAATQRAFSGQAIVNSWLAEHGVSVHLDLAAIPSLDQLAKEGMGTTSPLAVASGAIGIVGNLAMMLLLSVFFLLGGAQLADQVIQFSGGRAAADVRFVLCAVHDAFEGFARAQLLQGTMYAIGVWICLAIAQVDAAPVVGAVAGLLLIIPVVGAPLAVALPVLATLLWNPSASAAIFVGVALVGLEQLVLNVVGPRLMSRQLGMPPLLVLFGVLAGGQIAGFWGAVFGIPTLAALVTCLTHFRPRWGTDSEPGR
jgi:predicted PurR-regulated permease PerM